MKKQNTMRVEGLQHFPFKNIDELKNRISDGKATASVRRDASLKWIQNGVYSTREQRARASLLASLSLNIPVICFIIYIILTKTWILFIALPIFFITFFLLGISSNQRKLRITQLIIIGLVWGLISRIDWLIVLTILLFVARLAQYATYHQAGSGMLRAALANEDLLCALWNSNILSIALQNGDRYWFRMKIENGICTNNHNLKDS